MPLPIGPVVAVAARAIAKKATTRAAGGITGAGAKNVNSLYKQMISSKAKKEAAGYSAVAAGTTTWLGSKVNEQRELHKQGKFNSWKEVKPTSKRKKSGGSKTQKK